MNASIQALMDSDMPTAHLARTLSRPGENIRAGHQPELELAGNAFNATFAGDGVRIISLWDDDAAPGRMELDEFIRLLSAWPAKTNRSGERSRRSPAPEDGAVRDAPYCARCDID
jgi:hypothetical protein